MSKVQILEIEFSQWKTETDNAWLLEIGGKDVWLPKSQVELVENDNIVLVPRWLAEEKEIENDVV